MKKAEKRVEVASQTRPVSMPSVESVKKSHKS